jgi:prepilin-type processing-associated H-X9-DG protein
MGNPQRNRGFNGPARHVMGSNFGFADGHAKYLQPQQISPGYSNNNPACDQDYGNNPCTSASGNAAGTAYLGIAPENFRATYSPI